MKTTAETVGVMGDYVNSFTCDLDGFVAGMAQIHPTLQQTFTKLCLKWLMYMATTEYYDARNQASVEFAKSIKKQLDTAVIPMI